MRRVHKTTLMTVDKVQKVAVIIPYTVGTLINAPQLLQKMFDRAKSRQKLLKHIASDLSQRYPNRPPYLAVD